MQSPIANLVSPDTVRPQRIPPGQHEVKDWPVLHYGSVQKIDTDKWSFNISGLVENELKLSFPEFAALPQVEVFCDIHCVTTWSRLNNTYQGPSTRAIAEMVRPKHEAHYVLVHGAGGFTTNLPMADFLAEDALFAFYHDKKPLTTEHGGPVRLIVPRLYFWKSAKWVTGLEFTAEDHPGFWEKAGYHNHGDPWKEERYGR